MGLKPILSLLRRTKRKRRARQPLLLSGPRSGDPRLPTTSLDPNVKLIGEQMGNGGL